VTDVAVFVHDLFNFVADGVEWLAYWSCEKKDVSISPLSDSTYIKLHNTDFRNYQDKFDYGHDYVVLSQIHRVENFEGVEYVYPL
jgi:hypothetical protein